MNEWIFQKKEKNTQNEYKKVCDLLCRFFHFKFVDNNEFAER